MGRLANLSVLILLAQIAPVYAQETNQTPNAGPAIRVNVERVNLGVTVTGLNGEFVKGLRREDFRVFDNGVEQLVTDFLSVDEPNQLVLMMESGPAAFFLKKSELQAADELLASISPSDRVAVVSYSKDPEMVHDFTTDKAEVRAAIHGMNFMAGFGELNLASSIAVLLDRLGPMAGKKTIVLLSSGIDTSNTANWQMIQEKIRASDVRILAVSVSGDLRKAAKKKRLSSDERDDRKYVKEGFAEGDGRLRQLAAATGGRVYFPRNTKEFLRAYGEIAQSVRHEYSVAFVPRARDGQVHSLQVKVRHPWYRVESRQAYVAPSASTGGN